MEYTLAREIIYDHSARMMNIKKYYPYFKLIESDFTTFQGGKYEMLDMGYILMAILRYFIEENNFKEKDVTYEEYESFMGEIYGRDFDLELNEEEKKQISAYIFDKIRNDGKPFIYKYYDPEEKVRRTIRMRILDSRIKNDVISYYISPDAIEFYLDTKEIKDESTISIAQVLLGKMIESRNFKGGTEVIKRINSEVGRLKLRKNDVLTIMSQDVFEGAKAYHEFLDTGIRWFDEEQKLFEKNMELVRQALTRAAGDEEQLATLKDIYELETELKKAIVKHSELLNACTELQMRADELIGNAKFQRLRRSFDYIDALKVTMEEDRSDRLKFLVEPLFKLNIKKTFCIENIDKLFTPPAGREEKGEAVKEAIEEEYIYDDEIEDARIEDNYGYIILKLFDYILERGEFRLSEFNRHMADAYGNGILKNGDYYSLLVHLCQKNTYDIDAMMDKPDTFFERYGILALKAVDASPYMGLRFSLEAPKEGDNEIVIEGAARLSDVIIRRTSE